MANNNYNNGNSYNNGGNNNTRQAYSFLSIVMGLSSKGTQFNAASVIGTLSRISVRSINNNNGQILEGSMAVNGRSKLINKRFGTNYGDTETVWFRVQFWEPERVLNALARMGNPEKVRIALAGSLNKEDYTNKKDGRQGVSFTLSVTEWKILNSASNVSGNNVGNNMASQQSYNSNDSRNNTGNNMSSQYFQSQQPYNSGNGFNSDGFNSDGFDSDGFVTMDGEDDLPF